MLSKKNCPKKIRCAHLLRIIDRDRGRISFSWEDFHIHTKIKFKVLQFPCELSLKEGQSLQDNDFTIYFEKFGIEAKKLKCHYPLKREGMEDFSLFIKAINWNTWNMLVLITKDDDRGIVSKSVVLPMTYQGWNDVFKNLFVVTKDIPLWTL